MASYTGNLGLKKPALDDDALITDINNNMDILDAAVNGIQDGLAIVANGNTHVAISSGQFVYVRNHGTLTEGLYVASSNIAANATLSTSNLTADAAGGLNALNGNLTTLSDKTFSGITIDSCDSMSALKTALCTLAQNQGDSKTVNFRFYPNFTDADAGFYPAAYGERMGTMYIRNATHFTCIITFQDGTVTRMSNDDGTWHVDQLALNSKFAEVSAEVSANSSVTIAYPTGFNMSNSNAMMGYVEMNGTKYYDDTIAGIVFGSGSIILYNHDSSTRVIGCGIIRTT